MAPRYCDVDSLPSAAIPFASMAKCSHKVLVLCQRDDNKLRCRHCHLTISRKELGGGHCPECFAERGVRHDDFEEVETDGDQAITYRCEDCHILIESEPLEKP